MTQYLITVNRINETALRKDGLNMASLPETLNSVIEDLAPGGSLDLELVYLIDDAQYDGVLENLERRASTYPRETRPTPKVVNLHDYRRPPVDL